MTCKAGALSAALIPSLLLTACNLAPDYRVPVTAEIPPSFKEMPGWRVAVPSDAVAKGAWWDLFNDPILDALERRVLVSNQNLAAAKAAYDQARAMVREQRAARLPLVTLQTRASDSGNFDTSSGGASSFQVGIGATWEPDLWGAIGNAVSQASAQAQASAADLANATLSAQGEVALDYVQLRGVDAQKAALDSTVSAYRRALAITSNRYNAGVAARSDVLQAEAALHNALADDADYERQRAILEHAIAVLVGENPSVFSIAASEWNPVVPVIPSILPSTLLERRPDVAAAERRVAAANANIGIQRAAFFPQISLSGEAGQSASGLGALFSVASSVWSLGLTGLLTLLDFGANKAKVAGARAAHEQAVATYRQTALQAFQQTEDQLAAVRVLETVAGERTAASISADGAERIARNQYGAGLIAYSGVIVAQTTALSARIASVQSVVNRQTSAIALIQAIGGRWD